MAYFANSTESTALDQQCSECRITEACPVLLAQSLFNYRQAGNQDLERCLNLLIDTDGFCFMKKAIDETPFRRSTDGVA